MDGEIYRFDGTDSAFKSELAEIRSRHGLAKDEGEIGEIEEVIKALEGLSCWRTEIRVPTAPRGSRAFLVPSTYLHINVKRSVLVAAVILISLKIPVAAAVALLGQNKQGIAKLAPESGEYCNYVVLRRLGPLDARQAPGILVNEVANKNCLFPHLGCRLLSGELCALTLEATALNLKSLSDKGALEPDGERCRCSL
jgi:hypothetical protein